MDETDNHSPITAKILSRHSPGRSQKKETPLTKYNPQEDFEYTASEESRTFATQYLINGRKTGTELSRLCLSLPAQIKTVWKNYIVRSHIAYPEYKTLNEALVKELVSDAKSIDSCIEDVIRGGDILYKFMTDTSNQLIAADNNQKDAEKKILDYGKEIDDINNEEDANNNGTFADRVNYNLARLIVNRERGKASIENIVSYNEKCWLVGNQKKAMQKIRLVHALELHLKVLSKYAGVTEDYLVKVQPVIGYLNDTIANDGKIEATFSKISNVHAKVMNNNKDMFEYLLRRIGKEHGFGKVKELLEPYMSDYKNVLSK